MIGEILKYLDKEGKATLSEIVQHLKKTGKEVNKDWVWQNLRTLVNQGYVEKPRRGIYRITQKGREFITSQPSQ